MKEEDKKNRQIVWRKADSNRDRVRESIYVCEKEKERKRVLHTTGPVNLCVLLHVSKR